MSGCGGCGAESIGDCACDPALYVVDQGDGDEAEPCSLREFVEANADGLTAEDFLAVEVLLVGERYEGGGGAWATWSVRRVA